MTDREWGILKEIDFWLEEVSDYEPTDFERAYQRYIEKGFAMLPADVKNGFFQYCDQWIFHMHSLLQSSQIQVDAKERMLETARLYNPKIRNIEDMRKLQIDQLRYIANREIAKHRLFSFTQGGVSGTGSVLLLSADIPFIAAVNLRIVQLIAMTYGYNVNIPFEMMLSLKVFHGATLPKHYTKLVWDDLRKEVSFHEQEAYFYVGKEDLTNETWIQQPMNLMFKSLLIYSLRKKTIQNIPVVGMLLNSTANYQLCRRITEFAHQFYQYRYLMDKMENPMTPLIEL